MIKILYRKSEAHKGMARHLHGSIIQKNQVITELSDRIVNQQKDMNHLRLQNEDMWKRNSELVEQTRELARHIDTLKSHIDGLVKIVGKQEKDLKERWVKICDLTSDNTSLKQKVEDLKNDLQLVKTTPIHRRPYHFGREGL